MQVKGKNGEILEIKKDDAKVVNDVDNNTIDELKKSQSYMLEIIDTINKKVIIIKSKILYIFIAIGILGVIDIVALLLSIFK